MSRINGLTVSGVRSFNPDHIERITLYTPLTLIVGYNGSGKTTIIECLKYGTTGELPPNSKGGAFIHDPKLWVNNNVPAAVALKFTSLDGVIHTVNRKLQCSMNKAGNRTFKTLENSWKEQGEERNTSSKKSRDIDAEIPRLLGVSPAILDSVIFCHQDESLWPMSEPSALKKKFDEIFDAQKYTKGIEQLKLSRKKQGELLRTLQIELKQQEADKNMATQNSNAIQALAADIEKLDQEQKKVQIEVNKVQEKAKEKRQEANQFLSIINELENLENQFKFRQDSVKELRDSIDMMPQNDDELKKALDQYESTLNRLKGCIQEDSTQYYALEGKVDETRRELNGKLSEKGKLESDKEKHERQLQTRIEMIQHAAAKHVIRGFTNDLGEDQVSAFNEKIQSLFNNKKKEHDKLQNELARAADEAGAKISDLEGKKSSLTSQRTFAKQKRTENDRKVKRLQTEADSVECDEGHINILEKNTATLEERYQNAQNDFSQGGWDEKIQSGKSELGVLEKTTEELNSELVNCTRMSSERAQLDLRKKEMKEREGNFESLLGTYSGRISKLLKRDFDIESLGSDYKAVLAQQTSTAKETKAKCDALQKELDQRDFELTDARKRQANSFETKSKYEQSIMKVMKEVAETPESATIDNFSAELESVEDAKADAERELTLFDEMKNYYEKAQTYLNTKNKCRLCQRSFSDDLSKSKLMAQIAKGLSEDQKKDLEEEFHVAERKLAKLTAVRSDYEALVRLKSESSKIKREVEEAQDRRDGKLRQLEAAEEAHNKVAEALTEVESISKSVSEITQMYVDIEESREQISRLQSQSQMNGTGRNADEIQNAQSANSDKLKEIKKNLETLTRERQRTLDLIRNLELERSENKNKLTQARQQMDKKAALYHDIKASKDDNRKQDETVSTIDQDLKALQPQIDAARGQRDAELERSREKARLVAEERDAVAQTLNKLKIIEDDISDYVRCEKASALASAEQAIKSLQQRHESHKAEMSEIMTRINSQKEHLAQEDRRKKNINDNLRYREHCRTLDSLEKKIKQLRAHNAEEDYDKLMREAKDYEDKESLLTNHISSIRGTVGAKDETLKTLWENHETFYKGAEEKYRTTKMNVETRKAAIADLGTFGSALDKGIMQFHSLKMEEVNRIASELWRATYQGTDIDTIAIRSENETATSNSSSTRRNYNYRVTMVKQDTDMDMRGRCSAGQKVLASIIIRLALAESFGVNCGVIALDEPTTNLDSDNIRSLAVSLHGIIKARQAQENFQLIVITHDEEFLRHMRCNEFTDYYYRVKRDENQYSVIRKEDIARITE